MQKTIQRSALLAPARPSLTQRYEADLEGARRRKEEERERAKELAEVFGDATSAAASLYPPGYRANMKARGTAGDRLAVLALDDWEAQGVPEGNRSSHRM